MENYFLGDFRDSGSAVGMGWSEPVRVWNRGIKGDKSHVAVNLFRSLSVAFRGGT